MSCDLVLDSFAAEAGPLPSRGPVVVDERRAVYHRVVNLLDDDAVIHGTGSLTASDIQSLTVPLEAWARAADQATIAHATLHQQLVPLLVQYPERRGWLLSPLPLLLGWQLEMHSVPPEPPILPFDENAIADVLEPQIDELFETEQQRDAADLTLWSVVQPLAERDAETCAALLRSLLGPSETQHRCAGMLEDVWRVARRRTTNRFSGESS